jgi:hypothetical protein
MRQPRPGAVQSQEVTTMKIHHLSVSALSILFALGLAVWEIIFFFYRGNWDPFGWFSSERLGFNLAWLTFVFLSFQLVSIPFAMQTAGRFRFIGVVDGMASIVPLAVTLIVIFGRSEHLNTPQRWEAAILLLCISAIDLFGGYVINISLSRRMMHMAVA